MARINNSPEVIEWQVKEIMAGDLPDPTESTMGSRIEAVARLESEWRTRYRGERPTCASLAVLVGVSERTIERYRAKIRAFTLE